MYEIAFYINIYNPNKVYIYISSSKTDIINVWKYNILLYNILYVNKICKMIYLQSGLKTGILLSRI